LRQIPAIPHFCDFTYCIIYHHACLLSLHAPLRKLSPFPPPYLSW
jgi:hypothetical protein